MFKTAVNTIQILRYFYGECFLEIADLGCCNVFCCSGFWRLLISVDGSNHPRPVMVEMAITGSARCRVDGVDGDVSGDTVSGIRVSDILAFQVVCAARD